MLSRARVKNPSILTDESGYALMIVISLIALLTVITFGGYFVAQQALVESEYVSTESQSFQAANAAVDAAISNLQLKGYNAGDFPMTFAKSVLKSGDATVTVQQLNQGEYLLTSIGRGPQGSKETVKVRIYMLDLYGMNIAYGSGFNQGGSSGKFNGNASIYGPFYTMDNLTQGENLGMASSGGFGWGPIFIKNGTLDVKSGYLIDVKLLYVDPNTADPKVVGAGTRVVRSVPSLKMPQVDASYLEARLSKAKTESSDNMQGDTESGAVNGGVNTEVTTAGDPSTYGSTRCPGAPTYYKVVDDDTSINGSSGLTINSTDFGTSGDDFAYNATTRTLTVWGTVFIDGPLDIVGGGIHYVGNGTLVANGDVSIDGDFLPLGGMQPGPYPTDPPLTERSNQLFSSDEIVGIASPGTISLDNSSGGNAKNPDGAPTHAGAFFANESIAINAKVLLCGSLISNGIDVSGLNNMDLRTSQNLGKYVPHSMPGHGLLFQSIGAWSRY